MAEVDAVRSQVTLTGSLEKATDAELGRLLKTLVTSARAKANEARREVSGDFVVDVWAETRPKGQGE